MHHGHDEAQPLPPPKPDGSIYLNGGQARCRPRKSGMASFAPQQVAGVQQVALNNLQRGCTFRSFVQEPDGGGGCRAFPQT